MERTEPRPRSETGLQRYEEYRLQEAWEEFQPLLTLLERGGVHPSDESVGASLATLDAAYVHGIWSKALERRDRDPEGAITMARTLLESVSNLLYS